jgi:Asp-tRNA(Asn)/Glu-tRNA(Gln) amidotransferase C subunit
VKPGLTQEEALSGASRSHNGYFVVDAVFEGE